VLDQLGLGKVSNSRHSCLSHLLLLHLLLPLLSLFVSGVFIATANPCATNEQQDKTQKILSHFSSP
jgi:hypothetical protein